MGIVRLPEQVLSHRLIFTMWSWQHAEPKADTIVRPAYFIRFIMYSNAPFTASRCVASSSKVFMRFSVARLFTIGVTFPICEKMSLVSLHMRCSSKVPMRGSIRLGTKKI